MHYRYQYPVQNWVIFHVVQCFRELGLSCGVIELALCFLVKFCQSLILPVLMSLVTMCAVWPATWDLNVF